MKGNKPIIQHLVLILNFNTSEKLENQDTKGNKLIIIITELIQTLVLILNFDTSEKLKDQSMKGKIRNHK